MMYVGKREELILRRRQSLKSQVAVAAELGISQGSYSMIENGYSNPSEKAAKRLIEMFSLADNYFDSLERSREA